VEKRLASSQPRVVSVLHYLRARPTSFGKTTNTNHQSKASTYSEGRQAASIPHWHDATMHTMPSRAFSCHTYLTREATVINKAVLSG